MPFKHLLKKQQIRRLLWHTWEVVMVVAPLSVHLTLFCLQWLLIQAVIGVNLIVLIVGLFHFLTHQIYLWLVSLHLWLVKSKHTRHRMVKNGKVSLLNLSIAFLLCWFGLEALHFRVFLIFQNLITRLLWRSGRLLFDIDCNDCLRTTGVRVHTDQTFLYTVVLESILDPVDKILNISLTLLLFHDNFLMNALEKLLDICLTLFLIDLLDRAWWKLLNSELYWFFEL
jgi:hypothetical protein